MPQVHAARATMFVLTGMFIIGASDNLIVLISPQSSLWTFHLIRSGMVLGMLLIAAAVMRWAIWPHSLWRVSARNLFAGASMFVYFGALAFVPIGVAVAGMFTAPLFVLLFTALFRSEKVGLIRWIAVVIGFIGALLAIQPEDGALTVAAFVPIIAGVFYAIGAVATRSWCEGEDTLPMLVNYYVMIAIGAAIGLFVINKLGAVAPDGDDGFILRGWVTPDVPTFCWLVVQAVTSIFAVGCLTRGYQIGEATYVAVNEYSLILFASVFAWLFWGKIPSPTAILGMIMIAGAGIVLTFRAEAHETIEHNENGATSVH